MFYSLALTGSILPHALPRGLVQLRGRGCFALAEGAHNETVEAVDECCGLTPLSEHIYGIEAGLDDDDIVLGAPFGTLPGATALSTFLAKPKVEVVLALPVLYGCALFAVHTLASHGANPLCQRPVDWPMAPPEAPSAHHRYRA